MSFIVLHRPVASDPKLERVHMFPGRHLGEEEFDRQQAYADTRLQPLLKTHWPGVVSGLNLSSGGPGGLLDHASFVVNPGLAVTPQGQTLNLQSPLRADWAEVIEHYLERTATSDATGVYYLSLRQALHSIDSPAVDPCQRMAFDPTRDSRLVAVTSVELKRLAIDPALVASSDPAQLQNRVAADRVDGAFLTGFQQAVPLALLAVVTSGDQHQVTWVSEAAGRYQASGDSGYQVLLNQVSARLRQVMQAHSLPANSGTPLAEFLASNLHLDYLPAAGQLPVPWLRSAASVSPGLHWLPTHVGVDMVPVPADAVAELIQRHLPRRVIDLRQPAGDRIRLLLALNRADYRPDLLDIPPTDTRLEADIYRFYMRAYDAWHHWRQQFDRLYYVEPSDEEPLTQPAELVALEHRVLDPEQFKHLDLPRPVQPPLTPLALFQNVAQRAREELAPDSSDVLPYPYDRNPPAAPDFYQRWLVNEDGAMVPPPVPAPDEDGLVVQYAVALVELEAIENQIRAIRSRLEKTRDLVLLQRQQLDSQTVALSSLAGGVAGDGNGLQVARWLPYASLNTDLIPEELTPSNEGQTAGGSKLVGAAGSAAKSAASAITGGDSASRSLSGASGPQLLADTGGNTAKTVNFSGNLLSAALNTSTSITPSYLTMKPQSYSAFELGINKQRLDLLANLAKSAVSKPAYNAKQFRFGVLDHISPEINEYSKAYYGMQDLLATLMDLFDPTDASALRAKLRTVLKDQELLSPQVLEGNITKRTQEILAGYPEDQRPSYEHTRGLVANQKRYQALFVAGKVLTQWIAICEARYNQVERKLQGKLREHTRKLARIEKLSGLIRVARETLENLDRRFDEQVGDYGVAQRLLEEDWRQVYERNRERSRILTDGVVGLYYVRVRQTPVSLTLADPLPLRHYSESDPVPGCDWDTDAELPAELDNFFSAVTEIPMDDWAGLYQLKPKLPPFHKFEYLEQLRRARFQARPQKIRLNSGGDTLQARLQTVHRQTQSLVQQWAGLTLPRFTDSSVQTQAKAARVLSLEDLAQSGQGSLRKQAQTLRERLEQCLACLLDQLALLPGSIRLQWGQLAEDDRIRVEQVSWWPGLEQAEQDDFNATRTLAELVQWWFGCLRDEADGPSRNAMRNMIRAALIFASLGDPQEIVRGKVLLPPGRVGLGERFRVKLNRAPQPGVKLQLLDLNQQVAAELTVEDHSPDSTQVSIVNLVQPAIKINTQLAVVGNLRKQR